MPNFSKLMPTLFNISARRNQSKKFDSCTTLFMFLDPGRVNPTLPGHTNANPKAFLFYVAHGNANAF
jgi:hypothetical protein